MKRKRSAKTRPQLEPVLTCTLCKSAITRNHEIFAFGAKARRDADIEGHRGDRIEIRVKSLNRTVTALVPGRDSRATREGHDLYFVACSEVCAKTLKAALDAELKAGGRRSSEPPQPTRAAQPIGRPKPARRSPRR